MLIGLKIRKTSEISQRKRSHRLWRIIHFALILASMPVSAWCDVADITNPDLVPAQSERDPNNLHVLIIGMTSCKFCHALRDKLKATQGRSALGPATTQWNYLEEDKAPEGIVDTFRNSLGIPGNDGGYPNLIVFKNGKPLGMIANSDLGEISKFLFEATRLNPLQKQTPAGASLISRLKCNSDVYSGVCFFGLSGLQLIRQLGGYTRDVSTESFGRLNLTQFAKLFESTEFTRLFAPAPDRYEYHLSRADTGVFFIKNPFEQDVSSFLDPKEVTAQMDSLDQVPGDRIRLMFTGHGGQDGLALGVRPPKEGRRIQSLEVLSPDKVAAGIKKALAAKKEVKGIFLQCYGGRFAKGFMADSSGDQSSACAIFATIPDKMSEGCYQTGFQGETRDYLAMAGKLRKCDGTQDARRLHYSIVAESRGADIPMLTSEYFLKYGPALDILGNDSMVPPPPSGILVKKLKSGTVVYFDRVNRQVLRATNNGTPVFAVLDQCRLPANEVVGEAVEDCKHSDFYKEKARQIDQYPPFYLNRTDVNHIWNYCGAPFEAICEFESEERGFGQKQRSVEKLNLLGEVPGNQYEGAESGMLISAEYLKPEAKFILSRVLPLFAQDSTPEALLKHIKNISSDISKYNPALSDAMNELLVQRGRLFLNKKNLISALLGQFSNFEVPAQKIRLYRLAHLLSTAIAERELRKAAITDPKALALVEQLEALKKCETNIL